MKNSMPVNNELPYIRVPRVLLSVPRYNHLSADVKLLYSAMAERLALSDANGWYDDEGKPYICYTMYDIAVDFRWRLTKAMRMIEKLERAGLITRVKFGGCKPNWYYIHSVMEDENE